MKAFVEMLFYSRFFQNLLLSRKFQLFILKSKCECPNASAYQRQLKDNTKSLINCYERMIKSFDTIKIINMHFAMVYVIHKNGKFGEKEYHSDNRMNI